MAEEDLAGVQCRTKNYWWVLMIINLWIFVAGLFLCGKAFMIGADRFVAGVFQGGVSMLLSN